MKRQLKRCTTSLKNLKKKSKRGELSPDLFYDMYVKLCPHENARRFCNHIFRSFDTDNNGYVSFNEFLLAVTISSSGTPEEKLRWAFKLYDINGDGVINRCEMIMVVEAMFEMLDDGNMQRKSGALPPGAKERAKEMFAKLDVDGDLKVTKDEFIDGCLKDEELLNLLTSPACAIKRQSMLDKTEKEV